MGRIRIAGVAALALTTLLGAAGPAFAAPPVNDTYSGRTVVTALPFTDQIDTTEATRDADDDALASQCAGVPAWDATVWYEVTPTQDAFLVADFSESSYSAGGFVATGGPGNWTLVTCAPFGVIWEATAGVSYSLVVFDDQGDGAGTGGVLNLTIDTAPPPPLIDITVNPTGTFNSRTGSATLTGTVTCTGDSAFAFFEVHLSQAVGRFIIRGYGGSGVTCDGTTRPWSVEVFGDNGKFSGGKAINVAIAVACGEFLCGEDFEETRVTLKGGRR